MKSEIDEKGLFAKSSESRENIPAHMHKQMLRALEMNKKLGGKALAKLEAKRNVWQEVLDSVREIKAGGGKRTKIAAKSPGRRNNSTG